jgi:hypothetical protein
MNRPARSPSSMGLCISPSSNGTLVLPRMMAPALFTREIMTASSFGTKSLNRGIPQVVGRPATLNASFTVIGTPSTPLVCAKLLTVDIFYEEPRVTIGTSGRADLTMGALAPSMRRIRAESYRREGRRRGHLGKGAGPSRVRGADVVQSSRAATASNCSRNRLCRRSDTRGISIATTMCVGLSWMIIDEAMPSSG